MIARPPSLSPAALARLDRIDSPLSLLHPLPKRGSDALESQVRIRHPGYSEPYDVLLVFQCVDPLSPDRSPEYNEGKQSEVDTGVHHGTVLQACAIITGNTFDRAALTRDREGRYPIILSVSMDGVLESGDYWLQIVGPFGTYIPPNASPPYPVVASFSDWRFPHLPLPWEWLSPHDPPRHQLPTKSQPQAMFARIKQHQPAVRPCFVSGHRGATESAHILPPAMTDWFRSNMMGQYTRTGSGDIDDAANRMPLRADLKCLLDNPKVVIVPKPTQHTTTPSQASMSSFGRPNYALTIHVLKPKDPETVALYHNLSLQAYSDEQSILEDQNSRRFLFARFAQSVFHMLQPFLQAVDRFVLVTEESNGSPVLAERPIRIERRWMSPNDMSDREMQRIEARRRSRSLRRRESQNDASLWSDPYFPGSSLGNGLPDEFVRWFSADLVPGFDGVTNGPQVEASTLYEVSMTPRPTVGNNSTTDRPQEEAPTVYEVSMTPRPAIQNGTTDGGREESRRRRRRGDEPPPPSNGESSRSLRSSAPQSSSQSQGKLPMRSVFLEHKLT
ncbi:hypothetical protein VM1G_08148 [Cytospora mali]|uniref:HNH nuclease domain-containing protein n=1 Tax=Cytospora mali TaxID=578113 RepID=A0A194W8D0_CYTMA|nr:hypothetical protein VM1G_08148 [Valsa mali]